MENNTANLSDPSSTPIVSAITINVTKQSNEDIATSSSSQLICLPYAMKGRIIQVKKKISKIRKYRVNGCSITDGLKSDACINHYKEQLIKYSIQRTEAYRKKNLSCTKIHPFNLNNNMKYNKKNHILTTFVFLHLTLKDPLLSRQLIWVVFRNLKKKDSYLLIRACLPPLMSTKHRNICCHPVLEDFKDCSHTSQLTNNQSSLLTMILLTVTLLIAQIEW